MDDIKLIKEYFESDSKNDIDSPVNVIKIKSSNDYGEHYYDILVNDGEKEFTLTVFVQNNMVLVVPE